jgi:hypothetical protein
MRTTYSLHLGNNSKVLATVVPDDRYPSMWRIHWPDGSTSDMVNLERAKDAARAIVARNPLRNVARFKWRTVEYPCQDTSETPAMRPYSD